MKITIDIPYDLAAAIWDNATWGGKLDQGIEEVVTNLVNSQGAELLRPIRQKDRDYLRDRFSACRLNARYSRQ